MFSVASYDAKMASPHPAPRPSLSPAVFGFGTLVFNGLEIAMRSTTDTVCSGELSFAHPILQAIFTFLQMHFLFVNSEVTMPTGARPTRRAPLTKAVMLCYSRHSIQFTS